MLGLITYVLQFAVVASLYALAISILVAGIGYAPFHLMAPAAASAYCFALLTTRFEYPPLAAAVAAVLFAALIGTLCAEATRTLRGDGLALATFSIGVISFEISRYLGVTGGVFGLSRIPSLHQSADPVTEGIVAIGTLAVVALVVFVWRRSAGGAVVEAISMNEWGALSLGAPLAGHQRVTGLLAGAIAGCGGAYFVSVTHFVEPRIFQVSALLTPLIASVAARGHTPLRVIFFATTIVVVTQLSRFFGESAIAAGPLTEIGVACLLGLTLISLRLQEARRNAIR